MIILLSLAVCVFGFVWYLITTIPKREKLALVMFGCGLLTFLLGDGAAKIVTLFSR